MTTLEYGEKIAGLAAEGDWAGIEAEIHAINAPPGWQAVIRPLFDDLKLRELTVEVIAFEDLPDHVLHWLRLAPPEVLRHPVGGENRLLRAGYRGGQPGQHRAGHLSARWAEPDSNGRRLTYPPNSC